MIVTTHAYLTTDLWTNRIIASFQGITVYFINTKSKLRIFAPATDSFSQQLSSLLTML